MASTASRRSADRERLRGLPAYALPELRITGVFSWPLWRSRHDGHDLPVTNGCFRSTRVHLERF